MLCPSCGHQNSQTARFCDKCGALLTQGGQAGHLPPLQSQAGPQNTNPLGPGWKSSTTVNPPLPLSTPQGSAVSGPPSPPPMQPGGHGGIEGLARHVERHVEPARINTDLSVQVLTFDLEQYDPKSGNRTLVVPVEMRGLNIMGFIRDGRRVAVFGKEKEGVIRTKLVKDLDTGAIMKVPGIPKPVQVVVIGCLVAAVLVIIASFALVLFFGMNFFPLISHFFQNVPTHPTPPPLPSP